MCNKNGALCREAVRSGVSCCNKNKLIPHKHAEVIKAWADGAKIQFKHYYAQPEWIDIANPMWRDDYEYRVKPEPKPDVVMYQNIYRDVHCASWLHPTPSEANTQMANSCAGQIEVIFDGETGKLKSVEMVK